jgi:ribosomal protein L11 methyltransferase
VREWPALELSGLKDGDLIHAALTEFGIAAIEETTPDSWRVFFQTPEERDRASIALRPRFPDLSIAATNVPDEDWAARSQADLRAVQVGRIIVAPPWDAPITIVIQPSTGFGTGHHATTRLCLAALQRIELTDRTVLDVGTGSGVLAIAASRLGATEVTAIDDDEDAIRAAWDNLALNAGATVALIVGDLRTTDLVPADVVVANLTGGLLGQAAPRLMKLTKARGRVVISGFMSHEEREVVSAFGGFAVESREEEDGWLCATLTDRVERPTPD